MLSLPLLFFFISTSNFRAFHPPAVSQQSDSSVCLSELFSLNNHCLPVPSHLHTLLLSCSPARSCCNPYHVQNFDGKLCKDGAFTAASEHFQVFKTRFREIKKGQIRHP